MDKLKAAEKLGYWVADNPIIIIAAAVLLTLASLHYAQTIEMQSMNTESMVGTDSPLYQLYDHLYVEKFGTEYIAVLIEADDVTDPEILKSMLVLSDKMKKAPDVTSVNSIADIVAEEHASLTGIRQIPTQERIDEILTSPDNLQTTSAMMPDKSHTMLSIEIPASLTDRQRDELYTETNALVKMACFPPDVVITITGKPALMMAITSEMAKNLVSLMGWAVLLMVVALFLTFRHAKWCLLPIPIVFLGIVWTFGAMGLLNIPFSVVSMSAFPVLIGIGIDYAIQFHNRIDEEFAKGTPPVLAVVETISHVSIPVMIALVITAMGFVSLQTSSVPMIRDFGLVCLIGLVLCYLSALFVGVTLIRAAEKISSRQKANDEGSDINAPQETVIGNSIERISNLCLQKWKAVLIVALFLSILGTYADTQVQVDTDFKNYIPQDLPPLIDFWHMSETFGGTDSIKLLIQSDDVTDPTTLKWMDDFGNYLLESRAQIYGATSIATYVKQTNGGSIPMDHTKTRSLIDGLPEAVRSKYIDGHNTAIIDLNADQTLTRMGAEDAARLLKEIDKDIAWRAPPPDVSVRVTGDSAVKSTIIVALTTGRTKMTLLGLLLIFVVLLIIYRDVIKALLPVLPMLVVIGWMGGVMYIADLKYTPLTATLGALILGVGSEYSILMMERFYDELARVGEPVEALRITTARTGSALMASGLTTVFGFGALITSTFLITNNFGMITVLAVLFSLLTTFTVFIVLMFKIDGAKQELLKYLKFNDAIGG